MGLHLAFSEGLAARAACFPSGVPLWVWEPCTPGWLSWEDVSRGTGAGMAAHPPERTVTHEAAHTLLCPPALALVPQVTSLQIHRGQMFAISPGTGRGQVQASELEMSPGLWQGLAAGTGSPVQSARQRRGSCQHKDSEPLHMSGKKAPQREALQGIRISQRPS